MARMLNLADVFELIIDGFNDGALAQEQLVREGEQPVAHVFAQLGDQRKTLGDEELLGQRLGEIALIAKEFAEETLD